MDEAGKWRSIDLTLAVAAALIVIYGVLILNWSVFVVVALFWFENVVIGVLNVAKMLVTGIRLGAVGVIAALALGTFFTVHYGMFTVGHGVFVASLFGQPELGRVPGGLFAPLAHMLSYLFADREGWLAAIGIALLQTAAFVRWSTATRERPALLPELMFGPYGRIIVLHVTIIVSGLLVGMLKQPVLGALLLVALKFVFDIGIIGPRISSKGQIAQQHLQQMILRRRDDARRS